MELLDLVVWLGKRVREVLLVKEVKLDLQDLLEKVLDSTLQLWLP